MANTIPCPNPACPHDFSMAEVQSAAQLLCPKCGFRMQGKGQAKPAPPPAKPVPPASAKPAAPKAVAKPAALPKPAVAQPIAAPASAKIAMATPAPPQPKSVTPIAAGPAPPLAAPIPTAAVAAGDPPAAASSAGEESLPGDAYFNPAVGARSEALVRTGTDKRTFNWMRLLINLLAVGFAVCIVVVAVVFLMKNLHVIPGVRDFFSKNDGDAYVGIIKNTKNDNEKIYKLVLPRTDWSYDGELKDRFTGQAKGDILVSAWRHVNGYDFWFALIAKDYGMHKPRDAEMLRIGIEKLEYQFGADMELGEKAEKAEFGGLSAKSLKFRGVIKEDPWRGECLMFFNNGIAYWLILASPKEEVVKYFVRELGETHVFITSERKGWIEQPAPTEVFATIDNKLLMTAPKGVWDRSDPKSVDANGKLLLGGKYLLERDNKKNAILLVFTLEKQDDLKSALKTARDHLEAREKGTNDQAKVVHAADVEAGQTEAGTEKDVGNQKKPGRMIDLKLMIADEAEPQRYYLLTVINEPDVCYVIQCECAWASRQIWRQEFLDILSTLHVKKGE